MPAPLKVAILGQQGGTHVGGCFFRGAARLGHDAIFFNAANAWPANRTLNAIAWRLFNKRPPNLRGFENNLVSICGKAHPTCLVTTGNGPLTQYGLSALRRLGIVTVNFSTDDPWNPAMRTMWHLEALPYYDVVFTPRVANMEDMRRLGCSDVRYLPFGFDEDLTNGPGVATVEQHDVLFVGCGDANRLAFVNAFTAAGAPIALVGGYWDRYPATRQLALGMKAADELRALTRAAKINLCLVRHANRDGHVMRSFEIAASRGCMLAEDTPEHRAIFGDEGECTLYFSDAQEAAEKARRLLGDVALRHRLAVAACQHITTGRHTYTDRLRAILAVVREYRPLIEPCGG